jgi:4-hydroxy-3-methylbut-2-enyl diphosphate reductase
MGGGYPGAGLIALKIHQQQRVLALHQLAVIAAGDRQEPGEFRPIAARGGAAFHIHQDRDLHLDPAAPDKITGCIDPHDPAIHQHRGQIGRGAGPEAGHIRPIGQDRHPWAGCQHLLLGGRPTSRDQPRQNQNSEAPHAETPFDPNGLGATLTILHVAPQPVAGPIRWTLRPMASAKPPLNLLLAGPRGFCAGVDRAIKIVEEALKRHGAPVYVRHEIVHNRFVVESLEKQGAVFVEELSEIPDDGQPVVFSAHGVPKSVPAEAAQRMMFALDATCPLVSKVHREAERHHEHGRHLFLIGHAGHPEVIGTMGQLPEGAVTLVQDAADAESVVSPEGATLAYTTQTTLSVDDTAEIISILQQRFPDIRGPAKEDICYATTNRQAAVKAIAARSDLVVVVGAPNSSNSQRLREVAERSGAGRAVMVQRGADLDLSLVQGCKTVGVTAGASAPEVLVEEVIARLREAFTLEIEEVVVAVEQITFRLPRGLAAE